MFKVLALGTGDTFTLERNPSALVLKSGEDYLGIDCPDRYLQSLVRGKKYGWDWEGLESKVNQIFITHVHGDHVNGVEGFAFFKRFFESKKLGIVTTNLIQISLWERLRRAMVNLYDGERYHHQSFDDYFDFARLPLIVPFAIGPFEISVRATTHHISSCAVLVKAEGRTLGYSGDTVFDPDLITWLGQADLIIHETNLGPAHTAYADLLTLPLEIRNKMRLIHYPDSFDAAGSLIQVVRDYEEIVV